MRLDTIGSKADRFNSGGDSNVILLLPYFFGIVFCECHHASSSCRMGPVGDRSSCVDSKFRVHGVDNLRVVDASVFPRVPGAMPNGPTFTISRKAYEVILESAE